MPPRHLVLPLREAALNLATEEALFRTLPPGHPGLFLLWRNEPSVIVGRHQCAADEVDLARASAEGVPVVRRLTGGGAVFHDAGTLCVSLICHEEGRAEGPAFGRLLAPVAAALAQAGVTARLTGRNDLEAGGRKISGSAQYRAGSRLLCHATLLVRADVARMGRLLTPGAAKRRAHGVASVAARVGNVAEMWKPGTTWEELEAALLARCAPEAETPPVGLASMAELLAARKYRCADWNLDTSRAPARARRFPWGTVELRREVRAGRLHACRVTGDFFSDHGVAALEERLEGSPANAAALRAALAGLDWERIFPGCGGGGGADAVRDFFAACGEEA